MGDGRRRKASATRNDGRTAPRLSLRVASTVGATRSDRRGAVLPSFLVALAFLLRPSPIHFFHSRSWPSAEAQDLRLPDVRATCAGLLGGPACYASALLSVAADG